MRALNARGRALRGLRGETVPMQFMRAAARMMWSRLLIDYNDDCGQIVMRVVDLPETEPGYALVLSGLWGALPEDVRRRRICSVLQGRQKAVAHAAEVLADELARRGRDGRQARELADVLRSASPWPGGVKTTLYDVHLLARDLAAEHRVLPATPLVAPGARGGRKRKPRKRLNRFDKKLLDALLTLVQERCVVPQKVDVAERAREKKRVQDLSAREKCPEFFDRYEELKRTYGIGAAVPRPRSAKLLGSTGDKLIADADSARHREAQQ